MFKLIKTFRLFKQYKKQLLLNQSYLKQKYDFEINNWYEFYTTVTLIEAPEDIIKKFGVDTVAEKEISMFIEKITIDLEKLEMDELVNVYEIKRLNQKEYGITLGFRPLVKWLNNRRIMTIKFLFVVSLLSLLFFI